LAEALAAQVRRQMRRPQPALLHRRAQRVEDPLEVVVADLFGDRLDRVDLRADVLAHPLELLLELGLGREIPAHHTLLPVVAA
jgi:hypothetical protein